MPPIPRITAVRNHLHTFSAGFVLGIAFMASPAPGMILGIAAAVYFCVGILGQK